jgi:hypothetical protein
VTGPARYFLVPCLFVLWPSFAAASAACVMAKWQGNTLDYALAVVDGQAAEAQEAAAQALRAKGYGEFKARVDVIHPQAVTALPQGHLVVIKTTYKTARGKERTSYGCGFASASEEAALWEAMRNLQAHSWGWKPDQHGFEVLERRRY